MLLQTVAIYSDRAPPNSSPWFADEDFPDEEFPQVGVDIGVGVALGALAFFWIMFEFWDILFILIACGMAYRVGSGGQWWED